MTESIQWKPLTEQELQFIRSVTSSYKGVAQTGIAFRPTKRTLDVPVPMISAPL